jgi:hypothetical protein
MEDDATSFNEIVIEHIGNIMNNISNENNVAIFPLLRLRFDTINNNTIYAFVINFMYGIFWNDPDVYNTDKMMKKYYSIVKFCRYELINCIDEIDIYVISMITNSYNRSNCSCLKCNKRYILSRNHIQ